MVKKHWVTKGTQLQANLIQISSSRLEFSFWSVFDGFIFEKIHPEKKEQLEAKDSHNMKFGF